MEKCITIIKLSSVLVCFILLYNSIALHENNNYCREAERAEQEVTEICKRTERNSHNNHKLDCPPECIINKIKIGHIIIISHSIIYQDTAFSLNNLVTEFPERAPPI